MAKKSAREKLNVKKDIKIVTMDKAWACMKPGETMLVATPLIIDGYIRTIRYGQTETVPHMRDALAATHGCSGTCPMSTAIFIRMSAEAALEDLADGKSVSEVAPFWRIVSSDDKTARKLPLDATWIDEQRSLEAG
jgi:hypothetical protein